MAELKNRLSEYLRLVEKGEEVEIRKRNVPVARVVPLRRRTGGQPPGAGAGTVNIRGKLTVPLFRLTCGTPRNAGDESAPRQPRDHLGRGSAGSTFRASPLRPRGPGDGSLLLPHELC